MIQASLYELHVYLSAGIEPISDDAGFLYDFLLCHMEINDHVPNCNCCGEELYQSTKQLVVIVKF
jgi:hypothetical protein